MHIITKSWVLLLWTQTLTYVKCQDCALEKFLKGPDYDVNFETSDLQETYAAGRQIRVPCKLGYTGFFKLICTEGNWKPMGEKCEPKSCGHPGDAQFADFRLEIGEDFVFGSQVIYECQRGYHRVSRTNRRRCMAEGWDGVVPVCEAIKCPSIHVSDKVQVIGDPDEATFGNVVRFICKSNKEVLTGPSEIYCNERGEWSGSVPTCREISCDVPVIDHGRVRGDAQEYKEHAVLDFGCDPGYERTDGRIPKCTKSGQSASWIPTPACKQISCELSLPPLPGTTYSPSNKNLFLPGEKVQVICGDRYWILDKKTTWADVTCPNNGRWSINPVCQEVTCPDYIQEVGLNPVYAWDNNKMGNTVSYGCKWNYQKPKGVSEATCTRDGWTPKPLCEAKAASCQKPTIENGQITSRQKSSYSNGETLQYSCSTGVEGSFTATCERGTWTGITRCSGPAPCRKPEIPHGFAVGPLNNGMIYYSCDEGYKLFTKSWWGEAKCVDGEWTKIHECIENSLCGEAPVIPNGRVTRTKTGRVERFDIECDEGYSSQHGQPTCQNGILDLQETQLDRICQPIAEPCKKHPPRFENALIRGPYQNKYLSESSVTYQCRERYTIEMEGEDTITCKAGNWEEKTITCIAHCEKLEDQKIIMKLSSVKERYVDGDVIEYMCKATDDEGTAKCLNSIWTKTVECPGLPCHVGEKTPGLGYSETQPVNNQVNAGHKLRFFCSEDYDLEGPPEVTCLETGEWSVPFPHCSERCRVPDLPENVRLTPSVGTSLISKGGKLTFGCRSSGLFIHGKNSIECLGNGEWSDEPPTCKQGRPGCGKPPILTDGDFLGFANPEYRHGERVEYRCQNKYTLEGQSYKTCDNGVWTGDMRCLKPCTVDTQTMDRHNIKFLRESDKLYAPHNDHLTFVCKSGSPVGSREMRKQCIDGVMELPTCRVSD